MWRNSSHDRPRRLPRQTWTEGTTKDDYGKGSGSCFAWADFDTKKPWAWPVSDVWDVSCGNGNSIGIWKESTKLRNGWIAVEPPLEVI